MGSEKNMIDADKIIKKLEEKIEWSKTQIVEPPADKLDEIVNKTAEDFAIAYEEAIRIIKEEGRNKTIKEFAENQVRKGKNK